MSNSGPYVSCNARSDPWPSAELIITWCMATTIQSISPRGAGGLEFALEERQLRAAGVAAEVVVAGGLQAGVVVSSAMMRTDPTVKAYQSPASSGSVVVDGTEK